ncbi:hypothetical protein GPALN_003112 [Globodera pallida]|nr:hypothetical protein GPALN_003112 [Globodera pallida]
MVSPGGTRTHVLHAIRGQLFQLSYRGVPFASFFMGDLLPPPKRFNRLIQPAEFSLILTHRRLAEDSCNVEGRSKSMGFLSSGLTALAALPIPKKDSGIFYYEVTILEVAGDVRIGLAPTQMTRNAWVGRYKGIYAIDNRNKIWGHAVAGCRHDSRDERPYIGGTPSFYVGDVIGCGINLATRQIMYTTNGQRLDTTGLFVDSAAKLSDLFPFVSLFFPGTKIEANFGPNFEWKF